MKRGRRPGTSNAPATPLENEYGPSAFVSGEVPVNNAQKTGPKFGPRLTSLEEEMDLFQEKMDGLAYEHKVLMAEIQIVVDWIKEKFGIQLINQDSQILKFLHLTDGIKDLSKSLATPRLKAEQDMENYDPPQQRRGPPPLARARGSANYRQYEDVYNDQYDDQYEDDTKIDLQLQQQFIPQRRRRGPNVNNRMMAMAMAPNQPMVFDQSGGDEDEIMDDMELDQQEAFEDDDQGLPADDYEGEQEQEQQNDYDEVDGEGQGGQDMNDEEQGQDETEGTEVQAEDEGEAEDENDNEAPPTLTPAYGSVGEEDNDQGEQQDGDEVDDNAPGTPAAKEEEEQGMADEAGDSTASTEANVEGTSRSRSRQEQKQQPSPDRSSSRTRTRIAKAPKRYRDEDQTPVQTLKNAKPKPPRLSQPSTSAGLQRNAGMPQRPQAQMQQRKRMIVTSTTVGPRPGAPGIGNPQRPPQTARFNCMFPSCGKYFPTKDQLSKHHQLHKSKPAALSQTDIEKLTCEYCHKIFSSTWNLKTHYRTHTGEKPYPCNYCGQRFAYNQSRELHERHNHTLERPYVCNYCGKSFCASGELGSHLGRVHQRTYAENKRQLEEMEMGSMDAYDQGQGQRGGGGGATAAAMNMNVGKMNNKRQRQHHPAGTSGQGQGEEDDDYGGHFLCYD